MADPMDGARASVPSCALAPELVAVRPSHRAPEQPAAPVTLGHDRSSVYSSHYGSGGPHHLRSRCWRCSCPASATCSPMPPPPHLAGRSTAEEVATLGAPVARAAVGRVDGLRPRAASNGCRWQRDAARALGRADAVRRPWHFCAGRREARVRLRQVVAAPGPSLPEQTAPTAAPPQPLPELGAAMSRIQNRDTNSPMISNGSGVAVLNPGKRSATACCSTSPHAHSAPLGSAASGSNRVSAPAVAVCC
eukprot:SAG31_NODE_22_length_33849_cov_13.713096_21_plen_249_part_00